MAGSFSAEVQHRFPVAARTRGQTYYEGGAVNLESRDPRKISATVTGTLPYRVSLDIDPSQGAVGCSCTCPPYATTGEFCKHIWATLLEAEDAGLLPDRPGGGPAADRDTVDSRESFDDSLHDEDDDLGRDEWSRQLSLINRAIEGRANSDYATWAAGREIVYVVDVPATLVGGGLYVEIHYRQRKANGEWGALKQKNWEPELVEALPDRRDRRILGLLFGTSVELDYYSSGRKRYSKRSAELPPETQQTIIHLMCGSGRCLLRATSDEEELIPLEWDDGPPWRFKLSVDKPERSRTYSIRGTLVREDQVVPLSEPEMLTSGGILFLDGVAARLELGDRRAFSWISVLRRASTIDVPAKSSQDMIGKLLTIPALPDLDLPEELRFERAVVKPRPKLTIESPGVSDRGRMLSCYLSFNYGEATVDGEFHGRGIYVPGDRSYIERDGSTEHKAETKLKELGARSPAVYRRNHHWHFELIPKRLTEMVATLIADGWWVEADGRAFRTAGDFRMDIRSGIDWFELHGEVKFGDQTADLPELLDAVKRGERSIRLGDGTYGLLPEEWLDRYGMLGTFGEEHEGHIRYQPSQVALLDALLTAMPEIPADEAFQKARSQLTEFSGIEARSPEEGFQGTLREYQRDGLGWLHFLRTFGFGGCLADDMGLGKTVQVLALLEERRIKRIGTRRNAKEKLPPSIVVVPRTLVFNWRQEAERFTPKLRVHEHTGPDRFRKYAKVKGEHSIDHFNDHDLIVTTYGVLRRDAAILKDFRFDYAILDEAQAIKNAGTASAKAARLMNADNRLALSGTPIENHLGELWSLFEFLNPGMLGARGANILGGSNGGSLREIDDTTRGFLARALRPYILRRTKEQVASDLPQKTEQTVFCDLEPKQRKLYDELRAHYRSRLLSSTDDASFKRSKLQVLEALLRLRQAACHPGLVNPDKRELPSAKLSLLIDRLQEVIEEGHKALVFSQFTKMLGIVREELDERGIIYEYLDGRVRKRQPRIERFQNDPDCPLFLISLKAGGLGLNLTAADYVFLLDPWWNPAVEAQAIDRAHRIGQERHVFAYRLIAKDTVEEKVLKLQGAKRDLANAIINADNSLIRDLTRQDLELLLS